ncbi:hypothetical protein H4684_002453 [Desulfomicrobium macestii]|uniref:Uncharacterized protein n=2 Tax=Desulfomicrobium TaxID=898 RepID=A0A8G2F5M8_DESNO|nr:MULTISPECIES: hypothetical protein [Desulfomicrobium]MBE1425795.1 hypothetical protein [Desulfomicrobium macestii]SFL61016.1 hypothetical protein SAMN05421830_1049 [Desulfomicrobium norvegicum]
MRAFALFILLAVLGGCAPQIPIRDPEAVSRIWSTLHPRSSAADRITARFSMHVATSERTGRLVGQLWGYPASVIRMDLSSGTGASVAMIRETPDLWTAFIPSENKAYHHAQARAGLALFQIPVPFDARQIGSLLGGDLGPVLPPEYTSVEGTREGRIRFNFSSGDVAYMETPENMEMLILGGRQGWTLTCEGAYSAPAFPDHVLYDKHTFSSPRDGKAVLRVKSLDAGGEWQNRDLDLSLPQDVQWMRITSTPRNN